MILTLTPPQVERLTAFAAEECRLQGTGPLEVSYFVQAYFVLNEASHRPLDPWLIRQLGATVEPDKNDPGRFRQVPVFVGDHEGAPWKEVPRLIEALCKQAEVLGPTEFFREFEIIHPFVDGNGRVGSLLFNLLNGSLAPDRLEMPPNVFDDPRR